MTAFAAPPATAAWRHLGAREGFEVTFFAARDDGWRVEGWTTAVEDGVTWLAGYTLRVDAAWRTRSAHLLGQTARGTRSTVLEADGAGRWRIDGEPAPHLDGCLDVDLECSAVTNALPIRRLALGIGARTDAPAAFVRALDLGVDRLEQTYTRTGAHRLDYTAPQFGVACRLKLDAAGLVRHYPGLAVRVS